MIATLPEGGGQRSRGFLNWQFHNITVGFVTLYFIRFLKTMRVIVIYSHAIVMLCYDDDDDDDGE